MLTATFVDGVPTVRLSRANWAAQTGPRVVPLQAIVEPDFTHLRRNNLDDTYTILPGQYQ
ncbi:unnamed protein product, partial [Choristocarpus tenellus]